MPNLSFYAVADDFERVMRFVVEEAGCEVLESDSAPDQALRSMSSVEQIVQAIRVQNGHAGFMLYHPSMKGQWVTRRITLNAGAISGKTWRETVEGWGFISLQCGGVFNGALNASGTNHNSEKRAHKWAPTYPDFPPVKDWNFKKVTRLSSRINRYIRSKLSVRKIGSQHVLEHALHDHERGALRIPGL